MKRVVWEKEMYGSENGCWYLSAVSNGWNAEAMCYSTSELQVQFEFSNSRRTKLNRWRIFIQGQRTSKTRGRVPLFHIPFLLNYVTKFLNYIPKRFLPVAPHRKPVLRNIELKASERTFQNVLDVGGSVLHSIIHIETSNKMPQCIKILFHICIKFNMFQATHHPSSGD